MAGSSAAHSRPSEARRGLREDVDAVCRSSELNDHVGLDEGLGVGPELANTSMSRVYRGW